MILPPILGEIRMVEHRSSRHDVCKGSTGADQISAMIYDHEPKEGKVETIYTPDGSALQMYTSLPHFPLYGDKEFPHNRVASSLATRQHDGMTLSDDDKKALQGYREFPNSQELGYYADCKSRAS